MMRGKIKHSFIATFLAVVLSLALACPALADNDVTSAKVVPGPLYIGETGEIVVKKIYLDTNREKVLQYKVANNVDPDVTGFKLVNGRYIKSVKNKEFKGSLLLKLRVVPLRKGCYFRIIRPYFEGSLSDGSSKVSGVDTFSFRADSDYQLTLVCNSQEAVKWECSNSGLVRLEPAGKNKVVIKPRGEGKVELRATYMGYHYTTLVHILRSKTVFEKAVDKGKEVVNTIVDKIRNIGK